MTAKRVTAYQRDKSSSTAGLDPALVSRFAQAQARRGVPELGSRALLRIICETAALTRLGKLTDEQACARIALALLRAEDKAAELLAAPSKQLARQVKSGSLSLVQARAKLRGAA